MWMQMDRERRGLTGPGSGLMRLEEVPSFVLERQADTKSGTASEEDGLDDVIDERQRRRLMRTALAQSEVAI